MADYGRQIEDLARWCDTNRLDEQARRTRRAICPKDPYKLYIPALPREVGAESLPNDAPPKVAEWSQKFNNLRREQAIALFDAARRAVRTGHTGLAFDLVYAALQANPDLEPARKLLGYQKYRDEWRTPYELKKLRAGFVWSDKFGWLPKVYLARYEQGQRFSGGRWISAEDDAKRHADIRSGWDVETEHYLIRTNHSLEAAVALGKKLERLHQVWRQIFLRYYATEADVLALFDGRSKTPLTAPAKHDIVLFRDRESYNQTLKAAMPNIGISIGVYVDQTRRAYFFVGDEADDRTLYHEATHQLFHESRRVVPTVGRKANFWIVEGIAMYMESLREEVGYYVLGGYDDERLQAARYRLLHDHFYVPLSEFTGFGMEQLQKDSRIATLYSQAAGLTHFLIHDNSGRYREALVSYLLAVYTGRDNLETLSNLTRESYADLDRQYRVFLEAAPPREKKTPDAR